MSATSWFDKNLIPVGAFDELVGRKNPPQDLTNIVNRNYYVDYPDPEEWCEWIDSLLPPETQTLNFVEWVDLFNKISTPLDGEEWISSPSDEEET